jgi:hypothetical protein
LDRPLLKGQIARRAMLLGTGPMFFRRSIDESVDQSVDELTETTRVPPGNEAHPCREGGEKPRRLSEIRLVQAMRKIDPDMAAMIESLAPVYLVKR